MKRDLSTAKHTPVRVSIDPLAVAHACQQVSACATADEILECAARAARELTVAAACTAHVRQPDGEPWLALRIVRDGGDAVRSEDVPDDPAGELRIKIAIDGEPRGALVLDGAAHAESAAAALAPLITQIGIGLKQAALYAELDALVVREMQTSVEREAAMQLVLDSMHDGLLVCELDGRLSAIRSRSVTRVFGEPASDQPLWSYLAPNDGDAGLRLQLCWDQLVTDILPFELAVLQMPSQLRWAEQTFALAYQPVERDGALAQIVVSIRDITAEIAAQRANALAHELALVIRSLMADREGFFGFLDEVEHLLGELASPGVDTARWLHTLKGNTAMFGFHWFSSYCHQIEDQLAEDSTFDADCLAGLRKAWDSSLEPVRPFLGQRTTLDISVAHDELAEQIRKMRDAGVARELLAELERWRLEPVGPALERLARQAERIATQQGKQLAVELHGARLRFADDRMRKLLPPLVHAIRNAVDHGLETPDERIDAGKHPVGKLTLTCRHTSTEFAFVVTDDGRGVNWDRVRDKAARNGLPCATRDDLIEALFHDGMSTTDTVTDVSGRGVGMGALREVCVALGGGIQLESEPGRGTRLTCAVPCVP